MHALGRSLGGEALAGRAVPHPPPAPPSLPHAARPGRRSVAAPLAAHPITARRHARPAACMAAPGEISATDKLISQQEIPAFIPRIDIMTQVYRWANIEAGTNGMANFGSQMNVVPYYREPEEGEEEERLWGFDVDLIDDGAVVCKVGVRMDTEIVEKPDFIGIGEDGFPVNEGGMTPVEGKFFQIWKVGDEIVTDSIRSVLHLFCTSLMHAINKYYAFGSCFTDEL